MAAITESGFSSTDPPWMGLPPGKRGPGNRRRARGCRRGPTCFHNHVTLMTAFAASEAKWGNYPRYQNKRKENFPTQVMLSFTYCGCEREMFRDMASIALFLQRISQALWHKWAPGQLSQRRSCGVREHQAELNDPILTTACVEFLQLEIISLIMNSFSQGRYLGRSWGLRNPVLGPVNQYECAVSIHWPNCEVLWCSPANRLSLHSLFKCFLFRQPFLTWPKMATSYPASFFS